MKTSLKNRLRIILNFFAIIPAHLVTKKKGILVGAEERAPRPSSDSDGRIYSLAVPFSSKLKIWSFHVVVVQGRQRNVHKKRDARAEVLSAPPLCTQAISAVAVVVS